MALSLSQASSLRSTGTGSGSPRSRRSPSRALGSSNARSLSPTSQMSSRTGPFGSSSARGGNRRSPARSNEATGWTNATSSQAQTHYDSSPSPKPKRNARASTDRSAIIGNGSPLVHGDMFSRAGDLAWVRMCACLLLAEKYVTPPLIFLRSIYKSKLQFIIVSNSTNY